MENQRLRQMLGMKTFSESGAPLSPPISNSGSPMSQIVDSPQLTILEPTATVKTESDHKVIFIQRGLTPHSKFALCIFMVAIVSLNSVGSLILNNDHPNMKMADGNYNVESARRVILSTIDDVSELCLIDRLFYLFIYLFIVYLQPYTVFFNWKNLAVSILNFLIVMACLIKLLVYGEPIVDRTHCKSNDMDKLIQTTESHFKNGDLTLASLGYVRQLQQYGIYLPPATSITWIECLTYTTWQLIRWFILRLPFGLWLSHKVGGLFCSKETRTQAMNTYKEIGWILHRLNQIDLMELQKLSTLEMGKRRKIYGMMVALYAMNMCETAEPLMYTKEMVEVYLTVALRLKSFKRFHLLSSYYLRKAKFFHLLGTTQNRKFDWVFSEHGYKYVTKLKTNYAGDGERVSQFDVILANHLNCEPIAQVQQRYCKYLIIKSLENLLGFRRNTDTCPISNKQTDDRTPLVEQTQMTKVLSLTKCLDEAIQCETNNENDPTDSETGFATIAWIARIITIASYWMLNDLARCEPLYVTVDEFPQRLHGIKSKEKALLKSLYVIFVAKREFIHRSRSATLTTEKMRLILNRCNIASYLLQNYLTYNRSQNIQPSILIQLIQILTCDWLLDIRTECWELGLNAANTSNECDDEGISEPSPRFTQLELYQLDLTNLYLIFGTKPMGQSRINLYEAVYRLMANALPLETHRLLERNIMTTRQTKSNLICVVGNKSHSDDRYVCGERERARSMMLVCKYLQSQVGIERAGLLTQAATIFKQIGDTIKTNECHHLLNCDNGE